MKYVLLALLVCACTSTTSPDCDELATGTYKIWTELYWQDTSWLEPSNGESALLQKEGQGYLLQMQSGGVLNLQGKSRETIDTTRGLSYTETWYSCTDTFSMEVVDIVADTVRQHYRLSDKRQN